MSIANKGLEGIVAAETKMSYIDGEKGVLEDVGIAIDDLARRSSFEETVYLLWNSKRPTTGELAAFTKNGFVVSERLGAHSFAQIFYRTYNRHLPVFVTADALLHAWHRSYDAMLEELESTYLASILDEVLTGMAEHVPAAKKAYGDGPLGPSLADADYFLAVARNLLLASDSIEPALGADERVGRTLKAAGIRAQ
jgi:hypothetical protein